MRLSHSVLTALLICINSAAFANVEVTPPSNSELVLVNGKESVSTGKLTLDNGENQLALRYIGRYQQQGSQTQFSSDVMIMTFLAENTSLTITFPRIRSNSAADAFNREPKISLKDTSGVDIAFRQDKLIKDGMQLGRDYEKEIFEYNSSNQIAALGALAAPIAAKVQPNLLQVENVTKQANDPKQTDQINVGQMLDFWYQQADEETRKAFKLKINSKE
ncbi:YccT family protein [Shewanella kaireitica]|uniref:YccT family protein n=1 Tax=Shewanella kaireitica TaxID=212021 RepID=UPI00200F16EC|nr:DUF2057 domain-containing protein [Shewanella kaireitica]MCL1096290.1 DUF2057 domain-containing protein [Shewanella kaireitica]